MSPLVILRAALLSVALASPLAIAQPTPYYNPANPASQTGLTTGHDLFRTIGCPGRGILDTPCEASAPAQPAPPTPHPAAAPEPDSDGDGVVDRLDRCPGTPPGARVDARGCELDSDGDGVIDRLDQCPGTPPGAKVDARGCELDSDGDGVIDRLDQCPGTPPGARVDARGCELDSDGDGVIDRLDQCPGTPPGARVDARGCELDSDGDGVIDRLDRCPNTPTGTAVDAHGCPKPVIIELRGVHFDNDMAVLRPDARIILESAASTLRRHPGVRVEVAGHTDGVGTEAHNLDLSQRRAQAVLDYLVTRGIPVEQLSARGYGMSEPVADNYTAEGRAANRRVELRVRH